MQDNQSPHNPRILGIELKTIDRGGLVRLPRVGLFVPTSGDMSAALRAELNHYNVVEYLKLISALMSVREADLTRFDNELAKEGRHQNEVLRLYQIRRLVAEILESGASWSTGAMPHTRDIVVHCEWLVNSLSQADRKFVEEVPGDAWAMLWRMSYQQFGDLQGHQGFPRSLLIYGRFALSAADRHKYPLEERFRSITGIGLNEFWFLCMILCGWLIDNRGREITLKVISGSKDFPGLSDELGEKFLKLVACTRTEYVESRLDPRTGRAGYESYNLNPLLKWPLIKIGDDAYVAPSPTDLLMRASSGIYYDLMPADQGRFGGVLGDAFQEYVGALFKGLPGVPHVYSETTYVNSGKKSVTCDWLLVDGDTCVMVECKRSAVSAMAKITGDRSLISSDLMVRHGFVDGVHKLFETEKAIRQRCKGLEAFKDVHTFYGVVVVLDDFYMPNSPIIREIVGEALAQKGAILEDRIQFSHVGGLEWVANMLSYPDTSIARLMEEKILHPSNVELDFKNFVPRYARQILPSEEVVQWTPLFDDAYEMTMKDVVNRLQKNEIKN